MLKPEDSMSPDGPNATADGEVSISRSKSHQDGSVDAEVNEFSLARRSDAYAIDADGGTTLSNHPDARVAQSGHASLDSH